MALWRCLSCTTLFAVGLPVCPQCGGTDHEGDHMPKISRAGVSYEPGHEPDGREAGVTYHQGTGEPVQGVEHRPDGTFSPPVSNGDATVQAAVTVLPVGDPAEVTEPDGPALAGQPGADPEPAAAPDPKPRPARQAKGDG
jgi:hypothetical protein